MVFLLPTMNADFGRITISVNAAATFFCIQKLPIKNKLHCLRTPIIYTDIFSPGWKIKMWLDTKIYSVHSESRKVLIVLK